MSTPPIVAIRPCRADDCETLVTLVRELATYEKLENLVRATPESFRVHLFGPRPAAEALIAEDGGDVVGFAIFFTTFSTFRGQPGIYVEDIYVRPSARGLGIGKAILASVARQAVERGYGRVEWSVLNWNEPAIGFYQAVGAKPLKEWTVYRIDEEPLDRLASLAPVRDA